MKYKPLVSIVTICYNSENTIEDTITSVLNQTYKNIEYIIIDGGSTDNTVDIIKKYDPLFCKKGIKYLWISEKDKGIYNAMNKGIKLSSGEWIGIINSDDWYELDAVYNIVKSVTPKTQVIHGNMNIYVNNTFSYLKKSNKSLKGINRGMVVNHPTVFVKKEIYNKYGFFNEKLKIVSDWEFMLKINNLVNIRYLKDITISNFRQEGISSFYTLEQIREKHYVRKKLKLYEFLDLYYIYDLLKIFIFKEKGLNILLNLKFKLKLIINKYK